MGQLWAVKPCFRKPWSNQVRTSHQPEVKRVADESNVDSSIMDAVSSAWKRSDRFMMANQCNVSCIIVLELSSVSLSLACWLICETVKQWTRIMHLLNDFCVCVVVYLPKPVSLLGSRRLPYQTSIILTLGIVKIVCCLFENKKTRVYNSLQVKKSNYVVRPCSHQARFRKSRESKNPDKVQEIRDSEHLNNFEIP